MNILILSPYLPVPSQGGGGTSYFYYLKKLAPRHKITLLCLCQKDEQQEINKLFPYCERIEIIRLKKIPALWHAFLSLFTGSSFRVGFYRSSQFKKVVAATLQGKRFDAIIASHERMGQYIKGGVGIKKILDFHDIVSERHKMLARVGKSPLRRLAHFLEFFRLRKYEIGCLQRFDTLWVSTTRDAASLREYDRDKRLKVVRKGIELQDFPWGLDNETSQSLIFTGNMSYEPNVDGVLYFVKEIFPRLKADLPEVKFLVVGNYPHKKIQRLANPNQGIIVTGKVPAVLDYLKKSRVFVCPLLVGTGTRIKLLEAMAVGLPIVSTTAGCAGLGAKNEKHLLVADTPEAFSAAVRRLFTDKDLYNSLSKNSQRFVAENYDVNKIAEDIAFSLSDCRTPSGAQVHRRITD